ncbi:hypothetical protein [Lentzea sp. CA-135723]|uniref:hypothetical protein n=1 Tax=Lentzea sp. CA-135723 TaxID=3239950 RepID=UPI003D8DA704
MGTYLFSEYWRQHRPLVKVLDEWAQLARARADGFSRTRFNQDGDSQLVDEALSDWRRQATPLVRQGDPTTHPEPTPTSRSDTEGSPVRHWRWFFKFPVTGNVKLFEAWPPVDIEPCGDNLHLLPAPEMVWELTGAGPSAMFDVPLQEDHEGVIPPVGRVLAAAGLLDRIIEAINYGLADYELQLEEEIRETVRKRRARLEHIDRNVRETIAIVARERPPLRLETVRGEVVEPGVEAVQCSQVGLPVAPTRKTFSDLLQITQLWIDASQRYPVAFARLYEEEITSVLVTTLNLVFDTAQREVFIGSGKSDIYIEAEIGDRSRAAYVGESKFWDGSGAVDEHIRQLLGYAPSHIREVLFLYYVKNLEFDSVRRKAEAALSELDELFVAWVEPGKRATMKHPRFGHHVEVAILFAHFPMG